LALYIATYSMCNYQKEQEQQMKKIIAAVAALMAMASLGIGTVNWNGPDGQETVNWSAVTPAQATVNWNGPAAPDTVNWN
jgi:hypothetical protein